MIRSFVAIGFSREMTEKLRKISCALKKLDLKASYPRAEGIHLTLKFLGDIDESRISSISAALDEVSDHCPFQIEVAELGVFPHLGNPRVVWIGIRSSPELRQLQKGVESSLLALGFEKEHRPFKPHLTLARIKSRRNIAALAQKIREEGKELELGDVLVDRFHLYRSVLQPKGARYRRLHTIELRG